ncbi:uncharacterized protein BN452_00155 [Clostridium sp. CAG:1013]|nr:uncharacterized protein BN452_00155 [Clostridium sp. CAG:1013]
MNTTAYGDMIHLSRPISRHPKMSVENRAKLFAPFSALRGFDIEILTKEQDRMLVSRVTLGTDQQELIRHRLNDLRSGQRVTVTCFALAKELEGISLGEYVTQTGQVRRVDDFYQVLVLDNGVVAFEDIRELEVQNVEGADAS